MPAALANGSTFNLMVSMAFPMMLYILTRKEKWLTKAILPMAVEEKNIDAAAYEMVKSAFEHVRVKTGMPGNVTAKDLKNCTAPALVIAAEKDCMFPGKKVIAKAEKMIPHVKTHLLKNQGHMFSLPADVISMIEGFINEE